MTALPGLVARSPALAVVRAVACVRSVPLVGGRRRVLAWPQRAGGSAPSPPLPEAGAAFWLGPTHGRIGTLSSRRRPAPRSGMAPTHRRSAPSPLAGGRHRVMWPQRTGGSAPLSSPCRRPAPRPGVAPTHGRIGTLSPCRRPAPRHVAPTHPRFGTLSSRRRPAPRSGMAPTHRRSAPSPLAGGRHRVMWPQRTGGSAPLSSPCRRPAPRPGVAPTHGRIGTLSPCRRPAPRHVAPTPRRFGTLSPAPRKPRFPPHLPVNRGRSPKTAGFPGAAGADWEHGT